MLEKKQKEYGARFDALEKIYDRYEIGNRDFAAIREEIRDFRVNVPLVGGFSSGKTSLLNAVIGERLFRVSITPETAIPLELAWSDREFFSVVRRDGSVDECGRDGFAAITPDIREHRLFRVGLPNSFLAGIARVRIVDMPGFDSGLSAHEQAINDYLDSSMAYIVVIDAENGSVRKSVLDFLNELGLLDMPVYALVNKADKKKAEIGEIVSVCRQQMEDALGIKGIKTEPVSARLGETEPFARFLKELNDRAGEIFIKKFDSLLGDISAEAERYLSRRLDNMDSDMPEIERKEEELQRQLDDIGRKIDEAGARIEALYDRTVDEIRAALEGKLMGKIDRYASILVSNGSINDDIARTCRLTCIEKFRSCFETGVSRYLEEIKDELSGIGTNIDLQSIISIDSDVIKTGIKAALTTVLSLIGLELGGPIGAAIGAVLSVILEWIAGSISKKVREEQIKSRLREEIPSIISKVGQALETNRGEALEKIMSALKDRVEQERNNVKKAMDDLKLQKQQKQEEQERIRRELERDLAAVREMVAA
jgi:GTP-binding protein EngB required for normal cell division/gas vesicle protein